MAERDLAWDDMVDIKVAVEVCHPGILEDLVLPSHS